MRMALTHELDKKTLILSNVFHIIEIIDREELCRESALSKGLTVWFTGQLVGLFGGKRRRAPKLATPLSPHRYPP